MKVIGWDLETFKIAPGVAAPTCVCLSYDDGENQGVVLDDEGFALFCAWLDDPNVVLVAHSAVYDIVVMAAEAEERVGGLSILRKIFAALKAGRLRCSKIREKILENARGELKYDLDEDTGEWRAASFTLERCVWNRLKVFVKKTADTWRKRYGLLYKVPIAEWPPEAVEYSLKDSILCRQLFFAQETAAIDEECPVDEHGLAELPGETATTLTAFCLGLMRVWGVRTDPEMTAVVEKEFQAKYDAAVVLAKKWGLVGEKKVVEIRPEYQDRYDGSKESLKTAPLEAKHRVIRPKRNTKKIQDRIRYIYASRGQDAPMTEPSEKFPAGQISTDRETLTFKRFPTWEKDEGLQAVADVVRYEKVLKTNVPILKRGSRTPITPDWNEMVETFRISCARPNLTNQPRGTQVRNCFIPRPGFRSFAICDLDTVEMRALAQVCLYLFGYSVLAETMKEGKDVHVALAADTLEMPYEAVYKRYENGDKEIENVRQLTKHCNYGLGGGMGAPAFVDYARGFDVILTLDHAQKLHQAFRRTWPEMVDYFAHCSALVGDGGETEALVHPLTGYVRGKVRYTATCNHFFQHLVAVGAKAALCQVVEECYVVEDSPLFGCRAWLFEHDGIGLEVPWEGKKASDAAGRLQQIMIAEMKVLCPDVPIGATATLGRRWFKGAKPVRVDGILVPSKPQKTPDGRTIWVHDEGEERKERAAC